MDGITGISQTASLRKREGVRRAGEELEVPGGVTTDSVALSPEKTPGRIASAEIGAITGNSPLPEESRIDPMPVESAADALFVAGAAPSIAWSFDADENVSESPVLTPDGTIFIPDRGDRILGLKDGVKTWEYRLKKHVPGDAIKTPVFTPDGTMLVSVSNTLHALKGGAPSWSFNTSDPWTHMGAPVCGPDGTVYVSDSGGTLHALKDGKSLWSLKDSPWNLTNPAVGPDGTVYVARRSDGKALAIKNGEILWEYRTSRKWRRNCNDRTSVDPVAGPDGTLYLCASDGTIHGVKDGKRLWKCKDVYVKEKPVMRADGILYGSTDFTIFAIKNGKKLWEYGETYSQSGTNYKKRVSKPSVSSDGVVFAGIESSLVALREGAKIRDFPTGDKVLSRPAIDEENGLVHTGSWDKKIYAFVYDNRYYEKRASREKAEADETSEEIKSEGDWVIIGSVKLPVKQS